MKTRSLLYDKESNLHLQESELPGLQAGEVLIKVRACGLCTGELMDWYMQRKAPLVPGHELVGEIVEMGQGVSGFEAGERVVVHHHAPCGTCRFCRQGAFVHCTTWRTTHLTPGGLSQYAMVPPEIVASDLLKIPDPVSDERAVFTEPLACVVKSFKRAGLKPGDRAAVIGMGVMGLLNVMLAARWGAEKVFGLDRLAHRLKTSESLGAVPVSVTEPDPVRTIYEHTDGSGVEVVVVGPGSIEALDLAWQIAAPGGTVLLFTPSPPGIFWQLDWHTLYFREIRLVPSYSAGPGDMRSALLLIENGFPVEQLITHTLPLSQAAEGYRLMREAQALKVIIRP